MKAMKKLLVLAIAVALIPATVLAADSVNQGYVVDSRNEIVKSGFGLCWHTSEWTPARAVEGCDPTNKPVAVVTPAPAAAPAVMAAAPATASTSQKVSFSGDALFAFDKSVLKPEGKTMLDGLVTQLNGATYDTIVVTGHTDRFGSEKYNQKLSERRAASVKDYLVSKNVQANRIDAVGKGETQPMTRPGECRGVKSAKVVACLQPDRRVDVEMKGSRIVTGSL